MNLRWQERIKKSDAWVLSFLKQHEVPFIVVSGAAAAFHGCRDDCYFDDLDIDLSPSKSNSRRFANAMDNLARAAGINTASFPVFLLAKPKVLFNLDKNQCNVDFYTSSSALEFNKRFSASTVSSIGSMAIRIASPVDLIQQIESRVSQLRETVAINLSDVESIKSCLSKVPIRTKSLVLPNETSKIFSRLAAVGVPFLLSGGIAAEFYECKKPETSTKYEVLLRPDVVSLDSLVSALSPILDQNGVKNIRDVFIENLTKLNSKMRQFPLIGGFEILMTSSESEFDRQLQNSFDCNLLNGPPLKLLSLPDFLAHREKQVAFWQHMIDYKLRDLTRLKELKAS